MGKQIQVYLLPSDAEVLVGELSNKLGLRLLAPYSLGADPTLARSPVLEINQIPWIDCWFAPHWDAEIHTRHVPTQGYWVVDGLLSEIVEFTGCHFNRQTLKRGRLFFDPGFYGSDRRWKDKPKKFLEWANDVFALSKKSLHRDSTLDAYVGVQAAAWRAKGGVFASI